MIDLAESILTVKVRELEDADVAAWEQYVQEHPSATVFHRLAWTRAVEKAYGHRSHHLTAWQGKKLVGILPMMLIKSVFVGRVLVSIPYATYGGIVADSPAIAEVLLDSAEDLCCRFNCNYLELRHRDANSLQLPQIDRYVTFRKELPSEPGQVLAGLPRKARAAARNGLKLLGQDCSVLSEKMLDTVYGLYAYTLRRLGSPNYSRELFHALQEEYGGDCISLIVRDGSKPLAGVVSFIFRDEIVPYFSGSAPEATACSASNVMYLRLMEYAAERGLRMFDFNRTRCDNSGPYNFKRHQGFEPSSLHYQVLLGRRQDLPNLSPSNKKFKLACRMWKKMPLSFTQPVGAKISKWIP